MIRRYEMLPDLMRAYSFHVERFSKIASKALKRLSYGQLHAIRLLVFVNDSTESPHYAEIVDLLAQGCFIASGDETTPQFLTQDGLAKLYQRWAHVVCRPDRQHPPAGITRRKKVNS